MTSIVIRPERPGDEPAIHTVQAAAFGQELEANLVDAIRLSGMSRLSLVAEREGVIVGHIMFSPVTIDNGSEGIGLAPVGVLPDLHGQGIGSMLIRAGLAECRSIGAAYGVVLGEPAYYRRFGFERASDYGLANVYGADDEFRVILFGTPPPPGTVHYCPAFDDLE